MDIKEVMLDYLENNFEDIFRPYYDLVLDDAADYNRPRTNFNFDSFLEEWLDKGNLEDYSRNAPFAKEICKKAVLKAIEPLSEKFTIKNGKILLSRALVASPETLKDNIGECWSWDLNNAQVYDVPNPGTNHMIITAAFHLDAIEWGDTLGLNADITLGPAETEVRLKRGFPAEIIKVVYNDKEISLENKNYTS